MNCFHAKIRFLKKSGLSTNANLELKWTCHTQDLQPALETRVKKTWVVNPDILPGSQKGPGMPSTTNYNVPNVHMLYFQDLSPWDTVLKLAAIRMSPIN